ncbi:5-formyltetrahydrofolate cyclo-ligase (EC [Olavius algarvensis associated proteobacterium Delta 3]|nr:5-formyltetrahydrofolate cyclo-ligase (EC [Olavius algarvensis associated proteobacterium Delta 3]
MEDLKEKRQDLKAEIEKNLTSLSEKEKKKRSRRIEDRLFEFANFLESRIALLYISRPLEVQTDRILKRCFDFNKLVILPVVRDVSGMRLVKIKNLKSDLVRDADGVLTPDAARCQGVPIDCIDIAIIPGLVFDEKGGRIGSNGGYYNRLIPKLPITTRKVALAYEEQIVPQVPMEPNDKFVDIIISDRRIIYKI